MELPPSVQVPGPTFFPMIVIGLLLLMAVLSTVQILRTDAASREPGSVPHRTETPDSTTSTRLGPRPLDGRTWTATRVDGDPAGRPAGTQPLAGRGCQRLAGAAAPCWPRWSPSSCCCDPAGWIIAAAMLFWGVSYALGSRRPVFDISVALVMSSVIQLIFGAALGLNLPAGFLEGVL